MDMLGEKPVFQADNLAWPIHPSGYEGPATKILSADIRNSMIAEGSLMLSKTKRSSVGI